MAGVTQALVHALVLAPLLSAVIFPDLSVESDGESSSNSAEEWPDDSVEVDVAITDDFGSNEAIRSVATIYFYEAASTKFLLLSHERECSQMAPAASDALLLLNHGWVGVCFTSYGTGAWFDLGIEHVAGVPAVVPRSERRGSSSVLDSLLAGVSTLGSIDLVIVAMKPSELSELTFAEETESRAHGLFFPDVSHGEAGEEGILESIQWEIDLQRLGVRVILFAGPTDALPYRVVNAQLQASYQVEFADATHVLMHSTLPTPAAEGCANYDAAVQWRAPTDLSTVTGPLVRLLFNTAECTPGMAASVWVDALRVCMLVCDGARETAIVVSLTAGVHRLWLVHAEGRATECATQSIRINVTVSGDGAAAPIEHGIEAEGSAAIRIVRPRAAEQVLIDATFRLSAQLHVTQTDTRLQVLPSWVDSLFLAPARVREHQLSSTALGPSVRCLVKHIRRAPRGIQLRPVTPSTRSTTVVLP
jgi:hypothetical protein